MSPENSLTDRQISLIEKGYKLVEFSLQRTLEDIPEAEPCPFCAKATYKSVNNYSIEATDSVISNPTAPGYRCDDCGAKFFDIETSRQNLIKAANLLDPTKDSYLREILLESAERMLHNL